ncbi:MAG: UDP-N-acetylmuramoyl-tripeptide--D-alanyl-D-alanine ligase [Lachnospiraceae bacterium]|nr:UDP-N-acetylmuramoyl-tripeptide--D-alanyl-D-alanine ligase [Lachnospiraceae bacterium]
MGLLTIGEIAEMMGGTVIDGDPCVTISDYSYNSKEGDSQTLFLPIVGERVDAHDFISDAASHGMIATTTERNRVEEDTTGMTYIAIDNTRDAVQRLGARYRNCYNIPCIGVTGSVGKTTTKEMIYHGVMNSFNTVKTEGNRNGQLGVPLMCLKLDEDTECLILEMGVSEIGEMERLAVIAKPTAAVLTNIGMSHIGNFGSREKTRREKLAIVNEMDDNGVLLLNGEDELLAELAPGSPCQKDLNEILLYDKTLSAIEHIQRFSYGLSKWCDFRAENVEFSEKGTDFDWVCKDKTVHVRLNVLGKHNVLNAVAAMALAYINNADLYKAAEGLAEYRPIAMRGNIELLEDGVYLIDDSYNASPDSMKSGLDILEKVNNPGRKIAVLADMLELGEYSEECHRLVGQYVSDSKTDLLCAIGKESEAMAEEVIESGKAEVIYFSDRGEAMEYLLESVQPGDAVLCKGSRGMGLDKIAAALRKRVDMEK